MKRKTITYNNFLQFKDTSKIEPMSLKDWIKKAASGHYYRVMVTINMKSNNWLKMHGLPMRRKRRRR